MSPSSPSIPSLMGKTETSCPPRWINPCSGHDSVELLPNHRFSACLISSRLRLVSIVLSGPKRCRSELRASRAVLAHKGNRGRASPRRASRKVSRIRLGSLTLQTAGSARTLTMSFMQRCSRLDFSRGIRLLMVHIDPPLLGICSSRPPSAKFAEKFLRRREEGVLLEMPPNNDQRVRAHDVDDGISAELPEMVGADRRHRHIGAIHRSRAIQTRSHPGCEIDLPMPNPSGRRCGSLGILPRSWPKPPSLRMLEASGLDRNVHRADRLRC